MLWVWGLLSLSFCIIQSSFGPRFISTLFRCICAISVFDTGQAKRALIYGVREGGVGLAKNIAAQKPQQFRLFGFISHEEGFANHYLMGKKVYEVDDELLRIIKENRINAVLVSPLRNEVFRDDTRLQDILIEAGVNIYMTEGVQEWDADASGKVVNTLKEISIVSWCSCCKRVILCYRDSLGASVPYGRSYFC